MADQAIPSERRLEVIRLGHPVLRQLAEPVPEELLGTGRLHELARSMMYTMFEERGVGLAAPQVAEGLRLFVYWVPAPDGSVLIGPTVLVNPELRPIGEDVEEDWEGCLSIPGLRGLVPRRRRIKVKAQDLEGAPVSLTANGFQARVIQHEYDHLDGVVFLDRMRGMDSLSYEAEWEQFVLGPEDDEDAASAD